MMITDIYKMTKMEPVKIEEYLKTTYADRTPSYCKRVLGEEYPALIDQAITRARLNMNKVLPTHNPDPLIYDAVRHEAFEWLREYPEHQAKVPSEVLREADLRPVPEEEKQRMEVVIQLLRRNERIYLLNRYYRLFEKYPYYDKVERKVSRLLQGKGLAQFRFKEMGLNRDMVQTSKYCAMMDNMDPNLVADLDMLDPIWSCTRAESSSLWTQWLEGQWLRSCWFWMCAPVIMIAFIIAFFVFI